VRSLYGLQLVGIYGMILGGIVAIIFWRLRCRILKREDCPLQVKVDKYIEKRKKKFLAGTPFAEWRIPVMILTMSGVIFILITAMFGVSIDRSTGGVEYYLGPGDDWNSPFVDNDGDIAMYSDDRGDNNPMRQYPDWIYFMMVIGYFTAIIFFTHFWFEYMKWRWKHVPEEIRFVDKRIKRPAIKEKKEKKYYFL